MPARTWAFAFCRLPSLSARPSSVLDRLHKPRKQFNTRGLPPPMASAVSATTAGATTAAGARRPAALVWFRNDLRLADHEPLHTAALPQRQQPPLLIPFYCLDERQLGPSREEPAAALGLPTLGPHRLRLLLEACAALRAALQALSSDLLWAQGRPEAVVGRMVALAAAAGATHVSLHHYVQPGSASAELERAVAATFAAAAAEHGLPSSLHPSWGCTLYHPDDLPYHLFSAAAAAPAEGAAAAAAGAPAPAPPASLAAGATATAAAAAAAAAGAPPAAPAAPASGIGLTPDDGIHSSRGAVATAAAAAVGRMGAADARVAQQQQSEQQGQQQGRQQGRDGCGAQASWREQQRYACLPSVMSDMRRVLQAHTPVRPPLPAPRAADSSNTAADQGSCEAAVLPPLPHAVRVAAAEAGLLQPIPTQLAGVYAAAGAAAGAALAQWEALTGQCCAELAPAGSGTHDARSAVPFAMGEGPAVQRLRYYLGLGETDGHSMRSMGQAAPMEGYQDSRMQAAGVDSSAKLSAFLALGCLSPRAVHAEVLRAAAAAGETEAGTWREAQRGDTWRWLLMHLGIRDHFIFSALKAGRALEQAEGISGRPVAWRQDAAVFKRWTRGQTGLPFVDACMRELAATGYTSNRGRQNVASLLTKALGQDWRWGAAYFECLLVDHDWAVNLGNWAYNSGTGSDPRDRRFCTVSQGLKYDADAALVKAWVPELAGLHPAELAQQPWAAPPEVLSAAGVRLIAATPMQEAGVAVAAAGEQRQKAKGEEGGAEEVAGAGGGTYPLPMVDPTTQVAKGPKQKLRQR